MNLRFSLRVLLLPLLLVLAGSGDRALGKLSPEQAAKLPPATAGKVDFSQDIKPIIEASCIKCHGRGRSKGDFRLDTRATLLKGGESGSAVAPGKSQESLLIEMVSGLDPDNVMPKKGKKLTAEQVGRLRAWIDQGLPWDAGITFAKLEPVNFKPRQPAIALKSNGGNPIDQILRPYFQQNKIAPAKPVEDRVFARRAYLDVIGLLPGVEELDAFVADTRADKRARLVRRLLADNERYAEHWLTFWNDALRNDYRGTGYIDGGRKQITAWLFSALATNLPYDRFVAQLVNPTPESDGFTRGIVWRGAVNASQVPPMQAAQNISQIFMGVNLKCASCHDSFINDWTLAEAYGLANIYSDEPLEIYGCDKPTGKIAGLRFIYPELGEVPATTNKAARCQRLAEMITSKQDGRLSRTIVNRFWAKFFGRGLVEPVDDMEQPAWNTDLLDWLAEDLVANHYDLKKTIERILTSQAYQLPAVPGGEPALKDYVFQGPHVRRLSAEQFCDALGAITGVWHSQPAGEFDFSCLQPNSAAALAQKGKWIWNDPNAAQNAPPATNYLRKTITLSDAPSEAMAVAACDNSFTLFLNGTNIASGKDYGRPVLIDLQPHLRKGTNVLAVAAVNQSPDNPPPADQKAPEPAANPAGFFFFARIRQQGKPTDFASDASWVWSAEKQEGWEQSGFLAADWKPAAELGAASMAPWNLESKLRQTFTANAVNGRVRAALVNADSLMAALGRPNREQVMTSRATAATTLQALELTNGDNLSKLLQRGAEKLLDAAPASGRALASRLYQHAVGRKPTAEELKLAEELVGAPAKKEGVEDLLWAMAMLPEFQLIY